MSATSIHVHRSSERKTLLRGPLGAELLLSGESFSLVEHPLAPRTLGSPVHTHRNEDEYSYVLAGTIGVEIGGTSIIAHSGDLIEKPRRIPHAFWNPTDEPARILELITPGGFERYFEEMQAIFAQPGPPDLSALGELAARYDLELDPDSIPRLARTHQLILPG